MQHQFIRYFFSGSIALAAHLAILSMLVEFFDFNETLASGVGFFVAVLVNYTIQHTWVFQVSGNHTEFFTRYLTITLITFCVNLVLFWFAVNMVQLWYPLAQILTTGAIFVLNFYLNRYYTFKHR